tara:strand:- start:1550 stop:2386 length:837 start_codon:yes stop_codon:yes gene_type:complete
MFGISIKTYCSYSDTINKVDPVNGRKTGYWIITGSISKEKGFGANDKVEEGKYVNSRKSGKWIKYWPNGAVRSVAHYKYGRIFGAYSTYFQNGKIEEKGTMISGLLKGTYELYWPNGKLRQTKNFNKLGKTEGKVEYYYANGKKEVSFITNNGQETGNATWYYENGDKKKEISFVDGKSTNVKRFQPTKPIIEYKDPLIEKGPTIKGDFNNAQKKLSNGYGKTYDVNKNLLMDGEFQNGKLYNGRHYIYDEFGLLEKIKVFKNGVFVGNGVLGKNGIG